jgi:hypothetical protein
LFPGHAEGDESIAAHLLRLKDPHTGKPLSGAQLLAGNAKGSVPMCLCCKVLWSTACSSVPQPAFLKLLPADDRILPEIATFFIAGMDTTAHTIAWTLVSLHPYPCSLLLSLLLVNSASLTYYLCLRQLAHLAPAVFVGAAPGS